MRNIVFLVLLFVVVAIPVSAQKALVVYDATLELLDELSVLPDAEQAVYEQSVLPKLKAKYQSDTCSVEPELAGEVSGKFTKKGVVQKAAFYQVCQTGNGLGTVAVVIFENNKLVGIWGDESGWSLQINTIADLNGNGFDEFTLSYSGGMHQGEGGVGVELMEFGGGKPRSMGWFQGEKFMDTETESGYKVTVRTGKTPVFYRQKYVANSRGKLMKSGANAVFKLKKVETSFEEVK